MVTCVSVAAAKVDVSFEAVEALQPLPRLIYGLLYSPLLLGAPSSVTRQMDVAAAMQALWCALPPSEAACATYPVLSSYSDPDTLVSSLPCLIPYIGSAP